MPLARRTLIAGAAALPLVSIGRALAADFLYKLSNNLPAVHPLNVRVEEAVARIAAATEGRVQIKLFPDSQLGPDTETLAKLGTGELEMLSMSASIVSTLVPAASINGIGFAFKNYKQVWAAMDGKLGAFVREEIAKHGVAAVGRMWNNGFRQITTSTKPVRTPADLQGMKLRVPVSPLWSSTFNALGATPVSLNFNKVHAALQTGAVDGQENSLAVIQAAKLYEVQGYCSLTNHIWDGFWLLANAEAMTRLPGRDREIVEAEFDRSVTDERADLTRLNPGMRGDLVVSGLQLNAVEAAPFQLLLRKAGYYAEWRGRFGDAAWRLLEEAAGGLS
jgi:tripartite ATP-independent transporter DctP family solute receptor